MAKTWLSFANLSDHYERKARFLPGIISLLPLLPVSAAYGGLLGEWIIIIISGTGLGAVLAVAISHLASAFGNRVQDRLWPDWPHDAPTNRWLHPEDKSISPQQKKIWYKAIKKLIGLDIERVTKAQPPQEQEIGAIINDAVKALRDLCRKSEHVERLNLSNIDYGFARNLTGLRPIWISFSIGSALGCWAGYIWLGRPIFWSVTSTVIAFVVIPLAIWVLPRYVRMRAHYYAESLFGALITLSNAKKESEV